MKILLIHNKYQQKGGEDKVFELECDLLQSFGDEVYKLVFTNDEIQGLVEQIKTGVNLIYNKKSADSVRKVIEEFNPDIIHVHNFFPVASPSIFYVAAEKNIPVVVTLHNYRLVCPAAILYRNNSICETCVSKTFPLQGVISKCYRSSLPQTLALATMTTWHKARGTWKNKITQYITLSNFGKNKFLNSSLKLEEEQLSVKGNFVFDRGYDFNKEDYFLYVGRLSREKGIDLLLDAFKKVPYKIDIVGDGPEKDKVLDAIKSYPNITFSGYLDEKTIIGKMKKAKALVFPSVCYEGFPMVVLEAFSSGTPVIAAEMGSLKEIVKNRINGLHFNYNDASSLISKLDLINGKEDFINHLFKNSRDEYENLYTPEKNYQQLKAIYEKAISIKQKELVK